MTVTTVFGNTADGWAYAEDASYATARAMTSPLFFVTAGDDIFAGQETGGAGYQIYQGFEKFDTSGIPDTDTVSAVVLEMYGNFDGSTVNFTMDARVHDWGAAAAAGDEVAGASLGGKTLVATFASAGFTATGYNAFTESGTAFQSAINLTGTTYLILASAKQAAGTAPTDNEFLGFEDADTAGTTQDPKLTITHAAGGGGSTIAAKSYYSHSVGGVR